MKIITLTLNPAFDVHCQADGFTPYHESIVEIVGREAGGKGVNISRALTSLGRENLAVVIVGKENSDEFCGMLERDSLSVRAIACEGRIRENITLHETKNPETRISFGGFSIDSDTLDELKQIVSACDSDTVITLTGSNPKGVSSGEVLNILALAKSKGAKIVIDSRSVTLAEILSFKPWLIKPNQDEIGAYVGKTIETVDDAAQIARDLFSRGIENVMISLGGQGAVLATSTGTFYAKAPEVEVLSTVGAGDSSIAGFIDAFANGDSYDRCLVRAVAFGSAACMGAGTRPPRAEDVKSISERIVLSTMSAN